MKEVNFWKAHKKTRPIPKPKMKQKPVKDAKELVKLGIGAGVGLIALSAGLAALQSVQGD